MAKVNYSVGDTIQYRTSVGSVRTILVEEKDDDIKNGRSGFAGAIVGSTAAGDEGGGWGYDDQVIRVVKRSGQ